jgi:hypothetical protein
MKDNKELEFRLAVQKDNEAFALLISNLQLNCVGYSLDLNADNLRVIVTIQ